MERTARDPRIAALCEYTERLASHIELQRKQLAELKSLLAAATGDPRKRRAEVSG